MSFIVIEGLEGAGKSSAIAQVKALIEQQGHVLHCTREPGGTPMAEAIRDCVKQDWQEQVSIEAELFLMYAARAQLLTNVIRPALARGEWVLADRHDMSSQAYQGGGRQIPQSMLQPLREMTLQGLHPDLTLYLDVPPETGLARARGRGELDRIEQEDLSFFHRTRSAYLALCDGDKNAVVIDASQPLDKVSEDIRQALLCFLTSR